MGKVIIDFVGLFLFDNQFRDRKRVAVIDGSRSDHRHRGITLRPHGPFILVDGNGETNWPHTDEEYELSGQITFSLTGGIDDDSGWMLPRMATGCSIFSINPDIFDEPRVDVSHAIIDLRCGELTSWRWSIERGAFGSRVEIVTDEQFSMYGGDGRHIAFGPGDAHIRFQNTELNEARDDFDWLWYYVATGNNCYASPDDTGIRTSSDPPPTIAPYTLGCSNSQWP